MKLNEKKKKEEKNSLQYITGSLILTFLLGIVPLLKFSSQEQNS